MTRKELKKVINTRFTVRNGRAIICCGYLGTDGTDGFMKFDETYSQNLQITLSKNNIAYQIEKKIEYGHERVNIIVNNIE